MNTTKKEKHLQVRKVLKIGNKIMDGPLALYQPNNDFDWYEKDISIEISIVEKKDNMSVLVGRESISIWSDSTMNKEKDFFQPIIRRARWLKDDDLNKIMKQNIDISWPSVEVSLGNITNDKSLEKALINFQKQLKNIPYIPQGLSFERDVPDFEYDNNFTSYSIFLRNGCQSIEFSGDPILGDPFAENVFKLFNTIKNHMDVFDKKGWIERYNMDFKTLIKKEHYGWDYSQNT